MAGQVAVALLLLALLLPAAVPPLPVADAAMGCGTVARHIGVCIPFARSGAPPSRACCRGIGNLNRLASTGPDRRAACSCLKAIARSVPGVKFGYVATLPRRCRVHVPYPVRLSTDCSRVK